MEGTKEDLKWVGVCWGSLEDGAGAGACGAAGGWFLSGGLLNETGGSAGSGSFSTLAVSAAAGVSGFSCSLPRRERSRSPDKKSFEEAPEAYSLSTDDFFLFLGFIEL